MSKDMRKSQKLDLDKLVDDYFEKGFVSLKPVKKGRCCSKKICFWYCLGNLLLAPIIGYISIYVAYPKIAGR